MPKRNQIISTALRRHTNKKLITINIKLNIKTCTVSWLAEMHFTNIYSGLSRPPLWQTLKSKHFATVNCKVIRDSAVQRAVHMYVTEKGGERKTV